MWNDNTPELCALFRNNEEQSSGVLCMEVVRVVLKHSEHCAGCFKTGWVVLNAASVSHMKISPHFSWERIIKIVCEFPSWASCLACPSGSLLCPCRTRKTSNAPTASQFTACFQHSIQRREDSKFCADWKPDRAVGERGVQTRKEWKCGMLSV